MITVSPVPTSHKAGTKVSIVVSALNQPMSKKESECKPLKARMANMGTVVATPEFRVHGR